MPERKPKKSLSLNSAELIDVPRRWWQMKQVRLRCSCGWESEETWPAKPTPEIAYTLRWTMRVAAEQHWASRDHEVCDG